MSPIRFRWARLLDMSAHELHAVMAARESVFIVEQNCPYLDADALDRHSWHLTGSVDGAVAAYLRVVDPGHKSVHPGEYYAEPSIGRVLTAQAFRRRGLGVALMDEGIAGCERLFPGQGIRISAQSYLLAFYQSFGFRAVGDEYLEDGIKHYEMFREARTSS